MIHRVIENVIFLGTYLVMMKEGLINISVDGTVISIGADEQLTCAWSFDSCSHRMQEGEVRTES